MNRAAPDEAFKANVLTLEPAAALSTPGVREAALEALENGGVVLLPGRGFQLTASEREMIADPAAMLVRYREPEKRTGRPTVIFDPSRQRLRRWHYVRVQGQVVRARIRRSARPQLVTMLSRFGGWAEALVSELFPSYAPALLRDRITYRPFDRDDRQPLHADATYGFPTEGRSMLRVFCNVHPANRPRVWQVGEPFETFATRFLGAIRPRDPRLRAVVASRLGIAKGRPTAYDQMMVDLKKASRRPEYQLDAPREVIGFPSGSCWFAITDLVLHGAMSGQHSIDQTWYLPVEAMRDPAHASLRILERLTGRPLA